MRSASRLDNSRDVMSVISGIVAPPRHPGRFDALVDGDAIATLSIDAIERLQLARRARASPALEERIAHRGGAARGVRSRAQHARLPRAVVARSSRARSCGRARTARAWSTAPSSACRSRAFSTTRRSRSPSRAPRCSAPASRGAACSRTSRGRASARDVSDAAIDDGVRGGGRRPARDRASAPRARSCAPSPSSSRRSGAAGSTASSRAAATTATTSGARWRRWARSWRWARPTR